MYLYNLKNYPDLISLHLFSIKRKRKVFCSVKENPDFNPASVHSINVAENEVGYRREC